MWFVVLVTLSACRSDERCEGADCGLGTRSPTDTGSPTDPPGPEDCDVPGDEDQDGDADCADADCAPACDADADGAIAAERGGDDCDDTDDAVFPGAVETCGDGVDQDCLDGDDPCPLRNLADAAAVVLGDDAILGMTNEPAGDFDGDGVPDLLLGAYYTETVGAAWVISGATAAGTLDTSAAVLEVNGHPHPSGPNPGVGYDVAGVGDLDGDGRDDLLVGSFLSHEEGKSVVVYGGAAGVLEWGQAPVEIRGEVAGDQAGVGVAGPGDVTGDGVPDLLLGATGTSRAYLVDGSLAASPGRVTLGDQARAELVGAPDGWAGHQVAGPGDVDGDGVRDLLVAEPFTEGGVVYLVLGAPVGEVDLTLDADATLTGETAGDFAGSQLTDEGDFDGDGYADLLVGAEYAACGGYEAGAAYVLYGPVTGPVPLAAADAILVGEAGELAGDVAALGDVDGDAVDELVVGRFLATDTLTRQGATVVYPDPPAGVSALKEGPIVIWGEAEGHVAGNVGAVGDVDGDGRADLIVGAQGHPGVGGYGGAAYLVLGGSI